MREIKFRAWDKKKTQMYLQDDENSFNPEYNNLTWKILVPKDDEWDIDIEDLILMQYTGLKDKNGKEIYEDDIVKMYDGKQHDDLGFLSHSRVYWIPGGGFRLDWGLPRYGKNLDEYTCLPMVCFDEPEHSLEIIGNIYENPELIKEEDHVPNRG